MILNDDTNDLKPKKELLAQHRRNLLYYQRQAAQYGLEVPLFIHNGITAEREAIVNLERELASSGVSTMPQPAWQALVIETDVHWREIITDAILQLGGQIVECQTIPEEPSQDVAETCAITIVGAISQSKMESSASEWINNVVKLAQKLPIILLASCDDRDMAIRLRHAFRNNGQIVKATTIFKETFDSHWFSQVIHQIVAHGKVRQLEQTPDYADHSDYTAFC